MNNAEHVFPGNMQTLWYFLSLCLLAPMNQYGLRYLPPLLMPVIVFGDLTENYGTFECIASMWRGGLCRPSYGHRLEGDHLAGFTCAAPTTGAPEQMVIFSQWS